MKQQYIDPDTGETVDAEGTACEIAKNAYVIVEDDELEAIRIESTPRSPSELRARRASRQALSRGAYYIAPEDKVAQEAFAVIRDW